MRVLHVLDHSLPLQSGYVYRTMGILDAQRRLGWEIFAVTSPKHVAASEPVQELEGVRFYRTPKPATELPVLREFALMQRLSARLEEAALELKPDLIHAHSPALNGLPAVRVGRRLGVPVVYEVRALWEDAAVDLGQAREGGPRYRATRALETMVLKRAGAVTCICEGLRAEMVRRGVPADKVTVIPNAVDVAKFTPVERQDGELAHQLGLAGAPVLGFIGSFYSYEGLKLLVQSLPAIRTRVPGLKLLLVGGGPDEPAVRAAIAERGLADAVALTGRVPHSEVARYYGLVDVMVYPRLSMRLTDLVTPLKPLESMAQKQVVLASDVGGHRELIDDGETGFLFRAGDGEALAQRVAEVFARRAEWPRIRDAGRRFVETERNWEASVARYKGPYGRLLGRAL
jgi:PEP-CTERM/exosortase A-associated glycosyltransferase